ncbi:hypothetical protein [Mesorhizobium sp. B1-1-8]|uniref:hypothetical protein n=1 Tax=Mesorhizobium sp. B1-1-8 TaxID=2589976 RepID=UPI00112913B5|nr:hypothetical protein [Mesorhizobium sp. B1-1-8]UCI10731.1 hypothetical protein FJ974_28625 [Mesorhizobium sp. B1-1-8]
MTDSESSTSRFDVIGNPGLVGTVRAALELANASIAADPIEETDSVVALWQQWNAAHAKTVELCRKQQRLESQAIRMANSANGADGAVPEITWQDAAKTVGYCSAKEAEDKAAAEEQKFAAALWNAPARSALGVCAKLAAIIEDGQWSEECPDFPWPQLRSILADLVRIEQAQETARPAKKEQNPEHRGATSEHE